MTDIASLGLRIDSDGASAAAQRLDGFTRAAGAAERGAEGVGRASQSMSAGFDAINGNMSRVVQLLASMDGHLSRMASGEDAVSRATAAATAAMNAQSNAARAMEAANRQAAAQTSALAREAAAVKAQINPLGAASDALTGRISRLQDMVIGGHLSLSEMDKAAALATSEFRTLQAELDGTAEAQRKAAQATDEHARAIAALDREAAAIRANQNPIGTASDALNAKISHYQDLAAAGKLSYAEMQTEAEKAVSEFKKFRAEVDGSAEAQRKAAESTDRLRAAYLPLIELQKRYADEQAAIRASGLTNDEQVQALNNLTARHQIAVAAANQQQEMFNRLNAPAGQARTRVGYTGLSFQLNDVATMAMMGADWKQIAATQGGQIFQNLQMAEGGPRAALKQIGRDAKAAGASVLDLAARFPYVTAAIIGTTAAATAFYVMFRDKSMTAEEALERHAKLVRDVANEYGGAEEALDRYLKKTPGQLSFEARATGEWFAKAAKTEADNVMRTLTELRPNIATRGFSTGALFGDDIEAMFPSDTIAERYKVFEGPLRELVSEYANGSVNVKRFSEAIMSTEGASVQQIDDMRKLVETLQKYQTALEQVEAIQRRLAAQPLVISAERVGTALDGMRQFSATALPKSSRAQLEDLYQQGLNSATTPAQVRAVTDARTDAERELNRQLELTRQQDALSTREVQARTLAERAQIAALRVRLEAEARLGAGWDTPETRQKMGAASSGVYAQAEVQARDLLEQQQQAARMSGMTGLPAQIAEIDARYQDLRRTWDGSTVAIERLNAARQIEIDTATRAARMAPLAESDQRTRELVASTDLLAASYGQGAEQAAYLAEKSRLTLDYARQGIAVEGDLATAIEARAAASGKAAGEADRLARAQQRAMQEMEDFRQTSRTALEDLSNGGDFRDAFESYAKGKMLDRLNEALVGRQGEAGGGLFGDALGGFFGTGAGQRGYSAQNPLYVQPVGAGASGLSMGGLSGLPGMSGQASAGGGMANVLALSQRNTGLTENTAAGAINSLLAGSGTAQLDAKSQAWCAAYANAVLIQSGYAGTGSNMASSFLDWGQATNSPKAGDIVNLKSDYGSGHVGFFQGYDSNGNVLVHGGNQGYGRNDDGIGTVAFPLSQVLGYRTAVGGGIGAGVGYGAAGPLDLTGGTGLQVDQTITGLNTSLSSLTSGVGSIVDQFVPGFGGILSTLLQGMNGASGGSGGGGLFGSIFGGIGSLFGGGGSAAAGIPMIGGLYANGGVPPGGLGPYRNSVVDRPTTFAFANGVGLMGEAGPEAIMPLRRDSSGRLGVSADAGTMPRWSQPVASPQAVQVMSQIGVTVDDDGKVQAYVKGQTTRQISAAAPGIAKSAVKASDARAASNVARAQDKAARDYRS